MPQTRKNTCPPYFQGLAYQRKSGKALRERGPDRLHTNGYILDPRSKAKSLVLNAEGVKRSRELFEQHFGRKG